MSSSVAVKEITGPIRAALGVPEHIGSSATGIDALRKFAEHKAAVAAAEAELVAEMHVTRTAEDTARGVRKKDRGKGLDAEIGLAIGESPTRGSRLLRVSRALVYEMPNAMHALASGVINQERAGVVVAETNWLSSEHRQQVDRLMADNFGGHGPRKLGGKVRAHAQKLDQAGAVQRNEKAITERRVTIRPAAAGMAYLTALLPTQQAVSIYATLSKAANSTNTTRPRSKSDSEAGDGESVMVAPRTPSQIMADTLVERTTGQATADTVDAEVQLVMSVNTLFGDDDTPARLNGHGPIPAELARRLVANPDANIFFRRVFTRPKDHQLVGLESRRRLYPDGLRKMIALRDQTCRTPYCDALIGEYDHATPHRDGGKTTYTNGQGLCRGCNKRKENLGWTHHATPEQLTITTPTGHTYTKLTDPILEGLPPDDQLEESELTYEEEPGDETVDSWDESVESSDDWDDDPPTIQNDTCNYSTRTPYIFTGSLPIAS